LDAWLKEDGGADLQAVQREWTMAKGPRAVIGSRVPDVVDRVVKVLVRRAGTTRETARVLSECFGVTSSTARGWLERWMARGRAFLPAEERRESHTTMKQEYVRALTDAFRELSAQLRPVSARFALKMARRQLEAQLRGPDPLALDAPDGEEEQDEDEGEPGDADLIVCEEAEGEVFAEQSDNDNADEERERVPEQEGLAELAVGVPDDREAMLDEPMFRALIEAGFVRRVAGTDGSDESEHDEEAPELPRQRVSVAAERRQRAAALSAERAREGEELLRRMGDFEEEEPPVPGVRSRGRLTLHWLRGILRQGRLSLRRTHPTRRPALDSDQVQEAVSDHGLYIHSAINRRRWLIAFDETSISWRMSDRRTIHPTAAQSCAERSGGAEKGATTVLCVMMPDGQKMPSVVIVRGRSERSERPVKQTYAGQVGETLHVQH
jgi:hypothetical protein